MAELLTLAEFSKAAERISGIARRTGLYQLDTQKHEGPDSAARSPIYVKAESEQPIGSFKLRGAYNCVAQLSPEELRRGVITYSSGNHAQGVAYAARALGAKAVIVMPNNAPVVKIEATQALGAEIVLVGPASSERRARAEELAATFGYTIIPPYDHPAIIAGQGTCGLEILEQLGIVGRKRNAGELSGTGANGRTVILSPVSGGGLLSGIATAVKLSLEELRAKGGTVPDVQVWGAEPELAADAKESFDSRELVEWPAAQTTRTLADGLRTQSLGRLNFEYIVRFVDGIVTVSEPEIREAMQVYLRATNLVPEPSGAVTLAAALFRRTDLPACDQMVVVLSGGNIEPKLRTQLEEEAAPARSAAGV